MTVREIFNKKVKRNRNIFIFSLSAFVLSIPLSIITEYLGIFWLGPSVTVVSMILIGVVIFIALPNMKCPKCNYSFGDLTWKTLNRIEEFPLEVKMCPSCGLLLDTDYENHNTTNKRLQGDG